MENTKKMSNNKFWNDRYGEHEYAYGKNPNEFLKATLYTLNQGRILLPAEGEGRNAVYAAKRGWIVDAFDFSVEAQRKALKLADENNVFVNYDIQDIKSYLTKKNQYDVIGLVYVHLPVEIRIPFYKQLSAALKPSGHLILEAYSKKQLNNQSGGPKDINLLYDKEILRKEFSAFNIDTIEETEIINDEGKYHQGQSAILRMLAHKN